MEMKRIKGTVKFSSKIIPLIAALSLAIIETPALAPTFVPMPSPALAATFVPTPIPLPIANAATAAYSLF